LISFLIVLLLQSKFTPFNSSSSNFSHLPNIPNISPPQYKFPSNYVSSDYSRPNYIFSLTFLNLIIRFYLIVFRQIILILSFPSSPRSIFLPVSSFYPPPPSKLLFNVTFTSYFSLQRPVVCKRHYQCLVVRMTVAVWHMTNWHGVTCERKSCVQFHPWPM